MDENEGSRHPIVFRVRLSTLDAYLRWLDAQWADGHRKGADSGPRVVSEWATRRRRALGPRKAKRDLQSANRLARHRDPIQLAELLGRQCCSEIRVLVPEPPLDPRPPSTIPSASSATSYQPERIEAFVLGDEHVAGGSCDRLNRHET